MTLRDAATVWGDIAALPARYANALYELAAGRDMFNSQGYDFTGTWPVLTTLSSELAPAGLSPNQVASFDDRMTVNVKGGSYGVADCTSGPSCEATWWVFAGSAELPSCRGSSVTETNYTWGYFVNDSIGAYNSNANDTIGGTAFFNAQGQVLAAPIAQALSGWAACAPKVAPTLMVKKDKVTSSQTVAVGTTLTSVTDTDPTDIAADLNGTINWGDGSSSSLTLSGGHGSFQVHGWHEYSAAGTYKASVQIKDEATGKSANGTVKLIVS